MYFALVSNNIGTLLEHNGRYKPWLTACRIATAHIPTSLVRLYKSRAFQRRGTTRSHAQSVTTNNASNTIETPFQQSCSPRASHLGTATRSGLDRA